MSDYLSELVKVTGNEFATIVDDGIPGADVSGYIDTGAYALNALLSGSIYGGMPNNKVCAMAGDSSTGKSFASLGIVGLFLETNPDAICIYCDSEQAISRDMIVNRGIDPKRIAIVPVGIVEEFRNQMIKIVDNYLALPPNKRKKMIIVLDSLGMLSTLKEITDTAEGKNTADMTRARVIKSVFRVLQLKLGQAGIAMIVTNHVYNTMSLYSEKVMSGGSGLFFASSIILYLSKMKDKDGNEVVGNIIHCKLVKGRLTKENKQVDIKLSYTTGLDRYYGLLPIAEKYGIFKKVSTRYELPDGSKVFESVIYKNPEKYFTKDILDRIDKACATEFKYGSDLDESETLDAVATNAERDTSDDGTSEDHSAD
jgi:RecA/RadA recombinase